jgi:hypothetical protein
MLLQEQENARLRVALTAEKKAVAEVSQQRDMNAQHLTNATKWIRWLEGGKPKIATMPVRLHFGKMYTTDSVNARRLGATPPSNAMPYWSAPEGAVLSRYAQWLFP